MPNEAQQSAAPASQPLPDATERFVHRANILGAVAFGLIGSDRASGLIREMEDRQPWPIQSSPER